MIQSGKKSFFSRFYHDYDDELHFDDDYGDYDENAAQVQELLNIILKSAPKYNSSCGHYY